jgi:hypothetical protein
VGLYLHFPIRLLSHTDNQMALLCDVMTSGHPCIPSTFPKLSRDPLPTYGSLGRNENLSLCSLKEYPLGTGRLLASGEPISKFGFDLGFVINSFFFRIRFVVGWRGQDCPRSQAVGGKNGCDARGNFLHV